MDTHNEPIPTHLYVGKREAVIAETGNGECVSGEYLVQAIGPAQWEADSAKSINEAVQVIAAWKFAYRGYKLNVVWL